MDVIYCRGKGDVVGGVGLLEECFWVGERCWGLVLSGGLVISWKWRGGRVCSEEEENVK